MQILIEDIVKTGRSMLLLLASISIGCSLPKRVCDDWYLTSKYSYGRDFSMIACNSILGINGEEDSNLIYMNADKLLSQEGGDLLNCKVERGSLIRTFRSKKSSLRVKCKDNIFARPVDGLRLYKYVPNKNTK